MSIEDPRLSSIDNTSAADDFDSAVEQHLGYASETVGGIEVAQAETPDATRTDRLPAQTPPVEVAAATIPTEVKPNEQNVVTLPAGIELDNLEFEVDGENLVLVLADGTEIVVLGGAANIPTFVIGDVELPQVALFAALEGSNINVAAGPDGSFSAQGTPSASRNFNDDPIDAGPEDLALADLLGDTSFGDELRTGVVFGGDGRPSIPSPLTDSFIYDEAVIAGGDGQKIITGRLPFNPGPDSGAISAIGFVGASDVNEGDGLKVLTGFTSGGLPISVTSVSAALTGPDFVALEGRDSEGGLVFTISVNRATGDFTFELVGKLEHPDAGQNGSQDDLDDLLRLGFTYTVTDLDGDFVVGSFNIDVQDDAPTILEIVEGEEDTGGEETGPIETLVKLSDANTVSEDDLDTNEYEFTSGNLGIRWGADDDLKSETLDEEGEATGDDPVGRTLGFTGLDTESTSEEIQDAIPDLANLSSDGFPLSYRIEYTRDEGGNWNGGYRLVAYKDNGGYGDGPYKVAALAITGGELIGEPAYPISKEFGETVFVITLDPTTTNGTYTFELIGNLDHYTVRETDGGSDKDARLVDVEADLIKDGDSDLIEVDELDLDIPFTATDSDGDSVDGQFTVRVEDDKPVVIGDAIAHTVDEDDISTIGRFIPGESLGTSPNDGNADGSYTGSSSSNWPGPATVSGSFSGMVDFGADDRVTTYSIIDEDEARATLKALGLTSKGGELSFDVINGTLYAFVNAGAPGVEYNAGQDRLVFSLEVKADGDYAFKLFDQLDHDKPLFGRNENTDLQDDLDDEDVNAIDFGSVIQATDFDGDSVLLTNSFSVTIRDDVPELVRGASEDRTVDEDDISTIGNAIPGESLGTSPNDGAADGSFTGSAGNNQPGPAFISGSLAGLVKSGADEALTFSFINGNIARGMLESLGLSSKGAELSYEIRDGVLYAFDNAGNEQGQSYDANFGDRLVFSLTLNQNGSYEFRLYDQLDHDAPGDDFRERPTNSDENFDLQDGLGFRDVTSINFGALIKATDYDGDSVSLNDAFSIRIRDDVPELSGKEENRLVDEDDIKNGQSTGNFPNDGNGDGSFTGSSNSNSNGPANISGSLANLIKGGADDTVKFSFINENTARATLDRLGLKSEGAELSYDIRDGVLYAFDNAGSQKGDSYDPDNGDRLVFKLTLSEDGSYTFELVDQLDHDKPYSGADENTDLQDNVFGDVEAIDFGSIIKATDFDGDSVVLKDAFSITVKDDVPVLSGTKEDRIIDEDDISTMGMSQPGESLGTSPNDGASEDQSYTDSPSNNQPGPAYISGSLANLVRGGADDPITFSFINETAIRNQLSLLGLSSKGSTLSYDLQPNGVLYAFDNKGSFTDENYDKNNDRLVFSLKLNSDGSYEFRLFDQLDHDRPFDDKGDGNGIADENFDLRDGSYSEDVTAINFGKLITATDYDGDTISLDGAFSIKVHDDVPTAVARNTSETLVVDETSGQQNDDVAGSLSVFNGVNPKGTDLNMSAQFAQQANFVAAEINGGADDDVDVDWSLKISGGNGSASGLFTTDGRAIVLFLENGLIVGRYDSPSDGNTSVNSSDPAAFALHISDNGTLSMVQYVSIKHDDPADHDENDDANDNNLSTVVQSLAGKIDAVLTVTDYDGDKAVSEVAVGDRIQFYDDGPSINLIAVGEQNVVLQTQDAETIGFGVTDYASSTARFGGVFSIASSSYGADGAGSVSMSYALSLAKGNGSDSGLNHDGSDIKLFLADGTVYGMTQSGELVFSISVDSDGEVTLKQFREIDHSNSYTSGPYSPDVKTLTDGLVKLTATATIIDGDGDRATDSEIIDLGGNIKFQDDGPRINLIATDEQNVVLQTQDAETIGFGVTDFASSTARFGGVFSIASSSYGADGAGSVSMGYALSLAKGNGSDSGLDHDGSDIKLFLADGTVYGMTQSGELVFSISVDSNGEVTLKQFREIDHTNSYTSGPYSPDVKTLTDGLVKLTATATIIDDEGDKASDSETIDLGGNIKFQDDGPSVNVSASGEELVILQTQDDDTKGSDTDYSETSARFGGVFSIASQSYGADGAGTAATLKFALGLYVNAGTDSGLDSDGVDIRLFMVDGVVYGSTISGANPTDTSIMNTAVFKIAVDNDGDVKLTQFKEIDHSTSDTVGPYTSDVKTLANGLVKLTASATVIDDEGDKATDSETIDLGGNIKFQDAGPSVKSDTITVSVDEDGLQTAAPDSGKTTEINGGGLVMVPGAVGALTALFDFGADGAHATQAISLKPTTSPVDSGYNSKGGDVFIKVVDGTLTGFVAGTPERVVFELKVNANGSYTFELKDQIDHEPLDGVASAPNGQFDDAENLLSSIDLSSYIIGKDGDGDTVALTAGKFVVDVRDDIPMVTSSVVEVKIDTPQIVAPVEAKVANFVLVLDTSGSVNVEQFQIQVKNFLENLAATGAKDVRVHIVEFSGDADAVGTYDLIRNGVKDQSALDDALSDIAGLLSGGSTNYEAGMREALDWIEGIPARVLEVDDRTDDFDSSVGGSNDEAYILFNGSTQVAMVSGWTSSTELGDAEGSLTFGWGVDGENLSGSERLRFDFGAFNNYDGAGEYANLGNFDGVPVTSAQFKLDDKVSNGSTTFSYTVHFTDGTSPANGSQTVNGIGTLTITAPAGKHIAYIEFAATSGFGDVDLEKVTTAPDGPLANAHVNELIFLSDGEPNENETNNSSSASEALEQIKNEIAKIESGANAPGDQAFTIQAYGIKPTGNNLTNLGKVEGDGGVAENLTAGNTLSGEYASTFAGLAGTPGSAASTSANFNLSPLVSVGADEGLTFSMKSGTSGLPILQSGGVTLVYTVANNILTATAGENGPTVFTLSLAANGSGTFTLNKPIDGQGDRDVDFSSLIQAQDFDADAVSLAAGKFVVTVDGVPSGAPQTFETKEDESVSGTIAAIIGDDGVGQNGFSLVSGTGNGSLLLNTKTGEFTYSPNTNWYGTDTFTVRVTDDDGDVSAPIVVTVNVTPVNDAPTAADDSLPSIAEDSGVRFISISSLLGNDVKGPANEDGQSLTITGLSNVVGGTAVINGANVEFTPTANYNGPASFDYTVSDNGQTNGVNAPKEDVGTVSFMVTPVNDAPVARDDSFTISEDTDLVLPISNLSALTGNDSDIDGDTLRVNVLDNSQNGTISVVGGNLVFRPNANFTGEASFRYQVTDDKGGFATAVAKITVTPSNDAPVLSDLGGTLAYSEGQGARAIDADLTVTDVDNATLASATVQITGGYQSGEDVLNFINNNSTKFGNISASYNSSNGQLTLSSAGATATKAQFEAALEAVTYENKSDTPNISNRVVSYAVNDGDKPSNIGQATITVAAVNDAPVARDDSFTISEDTDLVLPISNLSALTGNDSDIDGDTLRVNVLDNSQNGTISVVGGNLVFRPNANFTGEASFRYQVTDDKGGFATAVAKITVTPSNDAPVLSDLGGTLAYSEGQGARAIDADLTVTDVDNATLASATVQITSGYQSGEDVLNFINNNSTKFGNISASYNSGNGQLTLSSAGATATKAQFEAALEAVTYENKSDTPNISNRVVSYAVNDGDKPSNIGQATITVAAVNDAPVITGDKTLALDEGATITVAAADLGFTDPDDTPAGVTFTVTSPTNGAVLVNGVAASSFTGTQLQAGQVSFRHDGSETTSASFGVSLEDGNEDNSTPATATVTVNVTPVPDSPVTRTFTNQGGTVDMTAFDKVVFNNTSISSGHNTVVTVSNFNVAQDKISISVGGTAMTGAFTTATDDDRNGRNDTDIGSSFRIVQLTRAVSTSDFDNDGHEDKIEEEIVDQVREMDFSGSQKSYVFIVYSGTGSNVSAAIYTVLATGQNGINNVSYGQIEVEHVMTLTGITYGSLNASHFVAAADPIILDLDKNGFAFSSIDNGVTFDINADGKGDQIAWTSDDGILAYDVDGNGVIDNGSEIFTPDFNGGKFASGVAALASLDSNKDGKIDASDDAFSKLQVWVDADNDGISDDGELSSLSANGVASISLTTDQTGGEEDGQTVFAEGEFTFADGSTGNFLEVGFDTIFGTENDGLTLHGGMGEVVMTGSAGADTFVFDGTALDELDVADVITDFSTEEGDVLDVTALLDSLLGEQPDATVETHLRATVDEGNTTVSVQTAQDTWKDVVVLQNHDTAIKVLFDDKHAVVTPHD